MTEGRFDPLNGRPVFLAPERSHRPGTAAGAEEQCPFCPGNEHLTPPEISRSGPGRPGGEGWRVRVIPNRYPIVGGKGSEPVSRDRWHGRGSASGAHEVVVLSPDHHRSLADLKAGQMLDVFTVLRDRARSHAVAGRAYTQVIVNHGQRGGASIAHPHAQLVAIDLEPPVVLDEVARIARDGHCVLCDEMRRSDDDLAVVLADRDVVVWCPWWSSTSFEMLLAPRRHRSRFEGADEELPAVARGLRSSLGRLRQAQEDAPYNLVVHSLPARSGGDYHWHIHIWPRLQTEASFERGTGIAVNTVDPGDAAAMLRTSFPSCGA
jgi:UDPglucose--hexose-1-phosphate uridylyltransferase